MPEKLRRTNKGFSLVEVVVTFGLIVVALFSYFAVLKTVTLSRFAKHQALVYAVAAKKIEELKSLPFSSLPASGAFIDSALSSLSGAQANLTINNYGGSANIKEATVSISWPDLGGVKNVEIKTLLTEGGI